MSTFVPRSRKQKIETDTRHIGLSELTKPQGFRSKEFSEPKVGHLRAEKSAEALDRLRRLYLAGRLKGMRLELPKRFIPDLETWLARVYRREVDDAALEEIAAFVCRLPLLKVN